MVKNFNSLVKFLILALATTSTVSVADSHEPLLNFKFNHLTNIKSNRFSSITDGDINATNTLPFVDNSLKFAAYDATWTYPLETKTINIDLGVTLRHLTGSIYSAENAENQRFQQVLPLLHASALFALPLDGLSAGIEGSHLEASNNQVYDYRAKVAYEWRKGFGLQGGWQHQQFSLDSGIDNGTDYKHNGPFIDFYLHF